MSDETVGGDTGEIVGGGESSMRAVAGELSAERARRAPPPEPPRKVGQPDPMDIAAQIPVREIVYLEEPDKPLTARQMARDLAEYRFQLAARLDGETPAPAERAPDRTAETPAEPTPQQQEQRTQQSAELLTQAAQLAASENPEDRAVAAQLIHQAAERTSAEKLELHQHTGQAYQRTVNQLESVVAATLIAEWGGVDPAQLLAQNPAAFARVEKMAAVHQALVQERAAQAQASERLSAQEWDSWARQEDSIAAQLVPETADPKFQAAANDALKAYGFHAGELAAAYSGREKFSIRDSRVQRVFADAIRYRQVVAAGKSATAKPVPPVQRPGASMPRVSSEVSDVKALDSRLGRTGSVKDAAALLVATRRAAAAAR